MDGTLLFLMCLKCNICTLRCSRRPVPRSTWAGPTNGESTSVSEFINALFSRERFNFHR
jgi:hypothetical protein